MFAKQRSSKPKNSTPKVLTTKKFKLKMHKIEKEIKNSSLSVHQVRRSVGAVNLLAQVNCLVTLYARTEHFASIAIST